RMPRKLARRSPLRLRRCRVWRSSSAVMRSIVVLLSAASTGAVMPRCGRLVREGGVDTAECWNLGPVLEGEAGEGDQGVSRLGSSRRGFDRSLCNEARDDLVCVWLEVGHEGFGEVSGGDVHFGASFWL